ncbi:MAG: amino acid permease [Marinilabiliales bacterium]
MNKKNIAKIGLLSATAIVVANMVGTGVFTSLGFQLFGIKSAFSILILWFIGGIVALCGAFSYGELGAALPRSGGEYHFLSKTYHPLVGFLSGWISLSVGFSAPIAAAAVAMGKYSSEVLKDINVISADEASMWKIIIAVSIVVVVSIIHLSSINVIKKFQNIFTGLKISLILILIICGFILADGQDITFLPIPGKDGSWSQIFSSSFAISLVFVMYSYSGWNASSYIINEIKNPSKNLPWSLFLGTLIVMLLYIPLNAVLLYAAPVNELMGQEEVAYIGAQYIFQNTFLGQYGGIIMGLLISIGLISAISSMIWAGPRVTHVMSEDTKILNFLSRKNKNNVPSIAILLQALIVITLILTSTFESIIIYIGFTLSLSSFLTVLGVIVLRYKRPELERPYKTFLYPVSNLIFLAVTGWMMYYVLLDKPLQSIIGLATISLGAVIYYINKYYTNRATK